MKKKIISALLCVAMVASMLVGCGGDTATTGGAINIYGTKAEITGGTFSQNTAKSGGAISVVPNVIYASNNKKVYDETNKEKDTKVWLRKMEYINHI